MVEPKDALSGVVIVNKDEGMTSQSVVNCVKRIFGIGKAGHTGTLDPLATGVLPVLIGRAVKASEFMLTSDKHYRATLLLGISTDTEDITGTTLSESESIPGEEDVLRTIASFVGKGTQVPPMYSALKVGGRKLYELAREGVEIKREARPIEIYSIDCRRQSKREYTLDVHSSKGTYIRTLCADIGAALGCGATMKALQRREASGFTLSEAHTLKEFEQMKEEERRALVIPTEHIFDTYPSVMLSDFFSSLAHSGQQIYLHKLGMTYDIGTRVKLYDSDGFFAIGEIRAYVDGEAIKPIRQFGKL